MRLLIVGVLYICGLASPAVACGADTDCVIGDRNYRIALPETHADDVPVPVIVFAHGYRGSSKGVMRNTSLRALADDLGAALIALNSVSGSWMLPNHPSHPEADGAEEFAYVRQVLDDASARFTLNTGRIMSTGFSSGAMLTWYLACEMPDRFAGYVPIAGTFWLEPPETCNRPVTSIVHIHGDADKMVPLDGRAIDATRQGRVVDALAMYRHFGGFFPAGEDVRYGKLVCDKDANDTGEIIQFCLFEGGHSFRTEFVRFGWEQLIGAGQL